MNYYEYHIFKIFQHFYHIFFLLCKGNRLDMDRFYFIEIKSKRCLNFLVLFQMSLAADRGENMMDQRSQIMTNSVSLSKCFSNEVDDF